MRVTFGESVRGLRHTQPNPPRAVFFGPYADPNCTHAECAQQHVGRHSLTTRTVERWERRAEVPLLLLALAFLVAYAWPVLDPRVDPSLGTFLDWVSWSVWAAFAVDFAVRLALAPRRIQYAGMPLKVLRIPG